MRLEPQRMHILPGHYQHSFISRDEAIKILSADPVGFQSVSFNGDKVSYIGPSDDSSKVLIRVPSELRFGHLADRSSVQELLDRTRIDYLFIDSSSETHLLLPTSALELARKLFQCAGMSVY